MSCVAEGALAAVFVTAAFVGCLGGIAAIAGKVVLDELFNDWHIHNEDK